MASQVRCQMKDLHSTPNGMRAITPAVTVVVYKSVFGFGPKRVPSCQECSDWAHSEESSLIYRKNGKL